MGYVATMKNEAVDVWGGWVHPNTATFRWNEALTRPAATLSPLRGARESNGEMGACPPFSGRTLDGACRFRAPVAS